MSVPTQEEVRPPWAARAATVGLNPARKRCQVRGRSESIWPCLSRSLPSLMVAARRGAAGACTGLPLARGALASAARLRLVSATGPVSEAEDRTQLIPPRGCACVCVCARARSFPLTRPNHRGWGAVGVDRPQGGGGGPPSWQPLRGGISKPDVARDEEGWIKDGRAAPRGGAWPGSRHECDAPTHGGGLAPVGGTGGNDGSQPGE